MVMETEKKEYFKALVEAMEDLVYVCGPDFKIEYMNHAMEKYLGRSAIGERCHEAFFSSDTPCPWCKHTDVIMVDRTVCHEITCPHDGRTYSVICTPVKQDYDRTASLNILHDVTGLRQTQKELEARNAQLLQAQKMEAIGTLAGGIAHDFNNLLGSILGYASLMKMMLSPNDRLWKYVISVEKAGNRAADLAGRLLAFSRKGYSEEHPVNMNICVANVIELLKQTVHRRITIELFMDKNIPMVVGSQAEIEQAVMNLCINAVHAIELLNEDEVQGTITVETRFVDGASVELDDDEKTASSYVMIKVTDTGCGISSEDIPKIFDPFFTTKGPGKGTGLGLAMVYGIVSSHGGSVKVESAVGKGTTFTIYWPTTQRELLTKCGDSRGESAIEAKGKGTILVVDDEPLLRDLLDDMLQTLGYRTVSIADGKGALEFYERHGSEVDLIILDVMMPGMSCLEVFRRLKEMNPDVKVLLASGYVEKSKVQQAKSEGVQDFIAKPFSVSELSSKISRLLKTTAGYCPKCN